jgi:hypothetical protein
LLPVSALSLPPLMVACLPPHGDGPVTIAHAPVAPASVVVRSDPTTGAGSRQSVTRDPDFDQAGAGGGIGIGQARSEWPSNPETLRPSAAVQPVASWPGWPAGLATFAVATYTLVAAVLLARLAAGLIAVAWLRRAAVAVEDSTWTRALERWRVRLRIGRRVELAW